MNIDINTNAKLAVQKLIDEVAVKVQIDSITAQPNMNPDSVEVTYDAEERSTYYGTTEDKFGERIAMFRKSDTGTHTVDGEDYEKLKKVASLILDRCKISNRATIEFVQECCFGYKLEHPQSDGSCVLTYVRAALEEKQAYFRYEFPIGGLKGELSFSFGGIEFYQSSVHLEDALPSENLAGLNPVVLD